ncbi:hypothetical protein U1Q18_022311, partial [Sarracenia purpurea var. burkii]
FLECYSAGFLVSMLGKCRIHMGRNSCLIGDRTRLRKCRFFSERVGSADAADFVNLVLPRVVP